MLHYAVNRPVGGKHGDFDLAPLLRWLSRYAAWLEDRARLNRYRQSFLYTVTSKFVNEAERQRRQAELNANPPSPGSILVIDEMRYGMYFLRNYPVLKRQRMGLRLRRWSLWVQGIRCTSLLSPRVRPEPQQNQPVVPRSDTTNSARSSSYG